MARIRTIKPEFFTSEDIVGLSPWARLLYIALWCESDREGRLHWKPQTFKLRYFPADKVNILILCQELLDAGVVRLYGDGLAHIPSFPKHQHVNNREAQSTLPAPPQAGEVPRVSDASARVKGVEEAEENPRVSDASSRVKDAQGGREGREGKERKEKSDEPDGSASPREMIWTQGVAVLAKADIPASQARSLLGKLAKQDESKLAALITQISIRPVADPVSYLVKAMQDDSEQRQLYKAL